MTTSDHVAKSPWILTLASIAVVIGAAYLTPHQSYPFIQPLSERRTQMLGTILVVILILMLVGAAPTWPHSRNWGYYPSGGLGLLLLILIMLLLMGRI